MLMHFSQIWKNEDPTGPRDFITKFVQCQLAFYFINAALVVFV